MSENNDRLIPPPGWDEDERGPWTENHQRGYDRIREQMLATLDESEEFRQERLN